MYGSVIELPILTQYACTYSFRFKCLDIYMIIIICNMFSFTANRPYSDVRTRSGPIHIDDVGCVSYYSYSRLIDCPYDSSPSGCLHSDDVGVHCIGKW